MENSIQKRVPLDSGCAARTYKVDDIAAILNIGRSTAYNLIKEGHFRVVRIGTSIRVSRKSFDDWLERQEVQ